MAADEKLNEAAELPLAFLDSLVDNVAVLDRGGTIVATNEAWRTFARNNGFEDDPGMVGTDYFSAAEAHAGEDAEGILAGLRAVMRGEESTFTAVYPCHSPTEERWFEMRASRFETRGETYVTVIHADITERKLHEQKLTDKTQRQELAQKMADLGHWTVPLPERVVECSNEIFRIFGLDPSRPNPSLEEMFQRYHEDDRETIRTKFERVLETGRAEGFTLRIRRPNGEIRHVRGFGRPRYDESVAVEDIFGVLQDITEQKQTEDALRESERRFRQLAENIDEVFWIWDEKNEEALYVSPAYESIWGRSTESFHEDPLAFLDAVHPEDRDRIEGKLPECSSGNYDVEYRIRQPDGSIRWIHDRAYPIENEEGEVYRIAGIAKDITEQKQINHRLRNLVNEKETLLQEVHHRVKNNLQIVLGLLGLQSRKLDNPEAVSALANSKRRIQSMALIHQKLYEEAHLSSIDFPGYVDDLVEQILETQVDPELDVTINTDIQAEDLDTDTIISCGLIVNELVTNALKHGFPNSNTGTITLEFFTEEDDDYHLRVSDDGEGTDLDSLEASNSLGLELVRNLATNQLHGEIDYTPNGGLTVEIVFPPKSTRYD